MPHLVLSLVRMLQALSVMRFRVIRRTLCACWSIAMRRIASGVVSASGDSPVNCAPSAMSPQIGARSPQLAQINIAVSDIDRALNFYRDVVGLTCLGKAEPSLAFLDAGGVRLMLSTCRGKKAQSNNSIIYFKVSDIESMHRVMVGRGAQSERPPGFAVDMSDHQLWTSFVRDPDGNLVGLLEEKWSAL